MATSNLAHCLPFTDLFTLHFVNFVTLLLNVLCYCGQHIINQQAFLCEPKVGRCVRLCGAQLLWASP